MNTRAGSRYSLQAVTTVNVELASRVIRAHPAPWPTALWHTAPSDVANMVVQRVRDVVGGPAWHEAVIAMHGDTPHGLLLLMQSEWDSRHFGFPMGRLEPLMALGPPRDTFPCCERLVDHAITRATAEGIRHLMCRTSPTDVVTMQVLQQRRFFLADTVVAWCLPPSPPVPQPGEPPTIRQATVDDIPALRAIALEAFGDPARWLGRFHADPSLPKRKADELYAEWVENAVRGTQADLVLVALVEADIAGFITCQVVTGSVPACYGDIPLNAVRVRFQRQGIYTALAHAALEWFRPRVPLVQIKTIVASHAVHRVWQRFGAHLGTVYHTWHRSLELS